MGQLVLLVDSEPKVTSGFRTAVDDFDFARFVVRSDFPLVTDWGDSADSAMRFALVVAKPVDAMAAGVEVVVPPETIR